MPQSLTKALNQMPVIKKRKEEKEWGKKSSMLWDHGDLKPTEENVMLSTL